MGKLAMSRRCIVCDQEFSWHKGLRPTKPNRCCSHVCNGRLSAFNRGFLCWRAPENELALKLVADGVTVNEMAAMMGFGPRAVLHHLRRLQAPYLGEGMLWSDEEMELLRDFAPVMQSGQISELTGRSVSAIDGKIRGLKIKRPASFYVEHDRLFHMLPPDLQEVIRLHNKLKRKLRDEEHCRSEAAPVLATRDARRSRAQSRSPANATNG